MPVNQGSPAALKKRPATPQHHGSRQRGLEPFETAMGQVAQQAAGHGAHGGQQQRRAQRRANPQAPLHEAQLGIVFRLMGGHHPRFKRHAALGAVARTIAYHFGMHGAGVGYRLQHLRFQSHSTDPARYRLGLSHLRTHGANIGNRSLAGGALLRVYCLPVRRMMFRSCWRGGLGRQVLLRFSLEAFLASWGAEIIGRALIFS